MIDYPIAFRPADHRNCFRRLAREPREPRHAILFGLKSISIWILARVPLLAGESITATILRASGECTRSFDLEETMKRVRIKAIYHLTQEWGYEPNEYSQLMVLLDERPLAGGAVDDFARIERDGDTRSARSRGWSTFFLNAGRRMTPRVHVGSEAGGVRLC